jgi:hypothetical protein
MNVLSCAIFLHLVTSAVDSDGRDAAPEHGVRFGAA